VPSRPTSDLQPVQPPCLATGPGRSEPLTIAGVIERIGMSSMEVSWALQAECDLRYEAERREAEGIEEWDPERAKYISGDLWDPVTLSSQPRYKDTMIIDLSAR